MKAYKGFNKNLKCRDFQYEIGKEYKEKKATVCDCGFHSCLSPIDVLGYYPPADARGNLNRFCEVEIPEEMDKSDDDSKVATKSIKINAEIGLKGLVEAGVNFILEKVNWENSREANTGDQSAATNTGYRSAATNTGNYSAATNTGDQSAATNTGDQSAATNTGNYSAATNTGNYSAATNTGDQSAATVEGADSIAIATGYAGKAKGALGCFIVIAERSTDYKLIDVKATRVDGKVIKANTYYKLVDSKFVEAED